MAVEFDLSSTSIPGLPKKLELKNAAEESTLKELLKVLEDSQKIAIKTQKSIDKLGNLTSGPQGAPAASAQQTRQQTAANKASAQQTRQQTAANKASAQQTRQQTGANAALAKNYRSAGFRLGQLGTAVKNAAKHISNVVTPIAGLAGSLSRLDDNASAAAGMLGQIPLIGTMLSTTFGVLASNAEQVYNQYTLLTKVGASFGGSMHNMIAAATASGLTIDQFNTTLRNSGNMLRYLGGTTEQGAKEFSNIAAALKKSNVSEHLARLGFTTIEQVEGASEYIAMLGRTNKLQGKSTAELVTGTGQYMKQLDALAKITGNNVSVIKQELEAMRNNGQVRARLNMMDAESQRLLETLITSIDGNLREGAQTMLMTGRVQGDAAIAFNAMMPEVSHQFLLAGQSMLRGAKPTVDSIDKLRNSLIDGSAASLARNETLLINTDRFAAASLGMANMQQQLRDQIKASYKDQQIAAENGKLISDFAEVIRLRIAAVSNKFTSKLLEVGGLDAMMKIFNGLANVVEKVLLPVFHGMVWVIDIITKSVAHAMSVVDKFLAPVMKFLPVAEALATLGGALVTTITFFLGKAATALATALLLPLLPFLAKAALVVAALVALVAGFKQAVGAFEDFPERMKELTKGLSLGFKGILIDLREWLGSWFGGISKDEAARQRANLDMQKEALAIQAAATARAREERNARKSHTDAISKENKERERINDDNNRQRRVSGYTRQTGADYAKAASAASHRASLGAMSNNTPGSRSQPASNPVDSGSQPASKPVDSGSQPASKPVDSGSLSLRQSVGRPSAGNMSESQIKDMIKAHEGVRYEPYQDSLGKWHIGYGHLIGDGRTLPPEYNRTFSKSEVDALFEKDYKSHRTAAERIAGFDKMNGRGQAALTDLTFNMGKDWLNGWPNTRQRIAEGDVASAADNLARSKWARQVKSRAPVIIDHMRNGLQAADGGVFNGPTSGYPATLHGNEAVVPLKGGNIPVELTSPGQSDVVRLMSALNKKIDELVYINQVIADLNTSQLRAQQQRAPALIGG